MEERRRERLVIVIATIAGISCILQNYFGGWEFWVPIVVLVATIVLWWVHITQQMEYYPRLVVYFIYSAFLLFYLGMHEASLFDISVSVALFMVTFTIADRVSMLNMILLEYALVMAIQFFFLYRDTQNDLNSYSIMRIIFHIGTVLTVFFFSRAAIYRRISENERIQKWKSSVTENNRDMEDFLSNISHELRTPVNVIEGMSALMQKNYDGEELLAVQEAGLRLAHQIEDIQDYTEIKRGELVLENENYMCVSLINDVVANYNSMHKDTELELVINLSPETPTMLNGDIRKLHKIFRHLMDNAIKFTRHGGVYINVFTMPRTYGVNLVVEITDTGIGMGRADIAKVSKGMYQANKKRNRSTGGIGIGLPIVYGFAHKMDGFVIIHSERGNGTTVRVSIPQTVVDPAPCLSIAQKSAEGIIFYIKADKYNVPAVRDFYRNMAVDLATGLKTRLYSAGERRELERLIKELEITHIFTGREEYEGDREYLDALSRDGIKVVVASAPGFSVEPDSGVLVMPKPLYAFPIVRILNGEKGIDSDLSLTKASRARFTGVSALIVDDEPMNLVVASGLMREYQMFTDTAESGKDAIKKYEAGEYDVVFMDHMMPEMDGVEAMKEIRKVAMEQGKSPIIIALTANALSGAREMFIKEGFDGFIAKPIDIDEFERVMKNLLPEDRIHFEGRRES